MTPTLTWSAVSGATSYDVYLDNASPTDPAYVATVATNSYTPAPLLTFQTYWWKVVPSNGSGSAMGCEVWHFQTAQVAPPGCTTLVSPANGATGVSTTPTLA